MRKGTFEKLHLKEKRKEKERETSARNILDDEASSLFYYKAICRSSFLIETHARRITNLGTRESFQRLKDLQQMTAGFVFIYRTALKSKKKSFFEKKLEISVFAKFFLFNCIWEFVASS